ncbi:MAG: hypothetical protein KF858_04450 [Candidatus Sumerlaeia bacterium]|nr:hypothetical protein [Candidatus Sumerlaeia bacterium]
MVAVLVVMAAGCARSSARTGEEGMATGQAGGRAEQMSGTTESVGTEAQRPAGWDQHPQGGPPGLVRRGKVPPGLERKGVRPGQRVEDAVKAAGEDVVAVDVKEGEGKVVFRGEGGRPVEWPVRRGVLAEPEDEPAPPPARGRGQGRGRPARQ